MASMRDIKRRKTSIQSTQQITKAMKLVSTVKLQRSKVRAEKCKSYSTAMRNTIVSMVVSSGHLDHAYMKENGSKKKAVILITSNRGLAGGYNSNVVKLITQKEDWNKEDVAVYAIGKKGRDLAKRYGYTIAYENNELINEPLYSDASELGEELLEAFVKGEIGEIYIAYTVFKNTVVHIPTLQKLLPLGMEDLSGGASANADKENSKRALMTYEPNEEEALNLIIPKYISSLIYGAFIESVASENGARMQAMDSATDNAEKMISGLELQYNRARQGAITQELTEIIGGADALSS